MIESVAYLSMHTSPLHQPGQGDAGGMNVYIHELACTMASRGIDAVVFTRRSDPADPDEVQLEPGYRVVHLPAGPPRPLPVADLPAHVAEFSEAVIRWLQAEPVTANVVHSHYWLSGWAGVVAKEALDVPLANSFHTLGRVRELARRPDEASSSPMRTLAEDEVIARSNCVIASTPYEFDDLVDHYGANPERLCVSPPGIDHKIFTPGDRDVARRRLGLGSGPVVLSVGRIQPLKGIGTALRAVAGLGGVELVVVGGPSGPDGPGELERLKKLAVELGAAHRIHFVAAQPHDQLADFYRAADALVMPSRTETFGLVAAEAQACGLPVVAARVGGLPYVVAGGVSGLLVDDHEPESYAAAIDRVISDIRLARTLRAGAITKAAEFSWPGTADRFIELYEGIGG